MIAFGVGTLDITNAFTAIPSPRDAGDRIGAAIAVGDVDNDGARGDLVFGAPFAELEGDGTDAGVVWIQLEDSIYRPVISGVSAGSHLGSAMALGDFRGAGYDQVLIGAPGAKFNSVAEAGLAVVFDGPQLTLDFFVQGVPSGFGGTPNPFDSFGGVLTVGDFDADGYDDAVFGIPDEDLNDGAPEEILNAGIVQIAYGSDLGLTADGNQLWTLEGSIGADAFANDNFGGALAVGDFNGDGVDDLAIGVPGAVLAAQPQTGFVQILYGRDGGLFADGFESGDSSAWE